MSRICEYGHGRCTAPDTKCPHWIGIFCELDATYGYINYIQDKAEVVGNALKEATSRLAEHYTPKAKPKVVIFDETPIKKDLHREN